MFRGHMFSENIPTFTPLQLIDTVSRCQTALCQSWCLRADGGGLDVEGGGGEQSLG